MSSKISILILLLMGIGGVAFGRLIMDLPWSASLLIAGTPVACGLFTTLLRSRETNGRS